MVEIDFSFLSIFKLNIIETRIFEYLAKNGCDSNQKVFEELKISKRSFYVNRNKLAEKRSYF